jgi:hypothetical protein
MKRKQDYPIDLIYDAVSKYDSRTATNPRPGRNEMRVICPVHKDNFPSCDLDLDRNIWVCRACGAGGDAIDLIIKAQAVEGHNRAQLYARAFEFADTLIGKPREYGGKTLPKPRYYDNDEGERLQETSREIFPYVDKDGHEIFQVVRINGILDDGRKGKTFRQRRRLPPGAWVQQGDKWVYNNLKHQPVPYGPLDPSPITKPVLASTATGKTNPPPASWLWTSRGLPKILFDLPDVLACAAQGGTLSHLEGERKVRALKQHTDWHATKIPGGAGSPFEPANLDYVRGVRQMLVWTDADDIGREGARRIAAQFALVIPTVRIIDIYGDHSKRDLEDWLAEHATLQRHEMQAELRALIHARSVPLSKT